ncbi:hypothetical protein [Microbacterium sp. SS28]|uniref:hypothetical protein n=1 Tax=Microbacterium sp. SS28 TaxID=2919948 RepID=UPI001FA9C79B|nr:hypothetical protein [Microbacterium sp. SS28]
MGDLEIRSGGVVAVDTASLHAAADRLDGLGGGLEGTAATFRRAAAHIGALPGSDTIYGDSRALFLAERADMLAQVPRGLARRLRVLAASYETIELRAQRAAAEAAGDTAAMARIDARLDTIDREHPGARLVGWWDGVWRAGTWPADFAAQLTAVGFAAGPGLGTALTVGAWALPAALRQGGYGAIPTGARLTGPVQPVELREVPARHLSTPSPVSLASAAERIPTGAAHIRVERYTMADGSRQFAVYIRGTSSPPFDMKSNEQLYGGERSASYEAVLAALRDAGAERGDVVHAFGHSQGAMIASHLALEGGFDTQTLVTFGSPVEADVGADTLSVGVRHTDDLVATLAGGGHDTSVGAPGSFVAERVVDPPPSVDDVTLGPHHLAEYEKTAVMLDESADPRMDTVRERFDRLEGATSVTVTEYAAQRAGVPATNVSASCGGAG